MLVARDQKLQHAVELQIDDSLLVARITGRLVHPCPPLVLTLPRCPKKINWRGM
jgi:adenylate kinase family enzyme